MVSIVIPAHNESEVIARTLDAIMRDAAPGEFEIIVVCNGCSDSTAAVARGFGPAVHVIECPVAGKPNALNLGDDAARAFPRIYIDADVIVTTNSIRALADRLGQGDVLAVAPRQKFELTDCSRAVRAYYAVQSRLPSSREGIGGSGVYALSELGRRRFGRFPAVTADDGYVRIQFAANERATIAGAQSIVFAPRRLEDLVAIKSRSHFGNHELARLYPKLWPNRGPSNRRSLLRLFANPLMWPSLAVFCWVAIEARRRARNRQRSNQQIWTRDQSSRIGSLRPAED